MKALWILPDEAKVVRYSELVAIYEREGSLRATALAVGSDASTVMRHLNAAGVNTGDHAVTRLKERIAELEAELADRLGETVPL